MKKELLTILLMILPIVTKADAVEINGITPCLSQCDAV